MIWEILLGLSSAFFGSLISRIFTKILVFDKGFNLYSGSVNGIQLFNNEFALKKTYDLSEFIIFIISSVLVFLVLFFIYRRKKFSQTQEVLVGSSFLVVSFVFNISTLFASYSGFQTLILAAISVVTLILFSFNISDKLKTAENSGVYIGSGIVFGFYLSVLLHKFTQSVALPLTFFVFIPFYFYLFSSKFKFLNSPGWSIFIFSAFFPYNKLILGLIGLAGVLAVFITKGVNQSRISVIWQKVWPAFVIFIFLFNPVFYFGNFDSVEEGFWAGWLERMLNGQAMYRDFAIYHPPVLPGGLYLFDKIFGASLYNLRLYFHLLQIAGLGLIYWILSKLTKNNWIRISIFILVAAYASTMVRNNIGIRLATGLAPLFLIYLYKLKNNRNYLFATGFVTIFALLTSVETGIASLAGVLIAIFISSSRKNYISNYFVSTIGFLSGGLMLVIPFAVNGSLSKFFEYTFFYARNFSLGYQNVILERPVYSTLIQWMSVNNFVSSSGFLWEIIKWVLALGVIITTVKWFKGKLQPEDALFGGIATFGVVLSRSALGRSDFYHISFVWIVSLLLLGYHLENISHYSKVIPAVVVLLLIFFVGRDVTQTMFFQDELIKFQSYGNVSGSYPSYTLPRYGIVPDIDTDTRIEEEMINYIDKNVAKNEYIFVFPHGPEIYFLSERKNATSFDSPTIFFTPNYQEQMVSQLQNNKPELIIYNPKFAIAGISIETLSQVNAYIIDNYKQIASFGPNIILAPKN